MGDQKPRGRVRRALLCVAAGVAVVAVALGSSVYGHEASIRNVYDELYLEGPDSSFHLALPGRGEVSLPADFVSRMSGIDRIADNYLTYTYDGDGLYDLLPGEMYESKGLYLTFSSLRGEHKVEVYADSGFAYASDGNGYCIKINWAYDLETRTLERSTEFLWDADSRDDVSAEEFLAATGLTREDVETWADHALDGLVVGGYLEANEGRTRFSEGDVGDLAVTDTTDWGSAA